jgi:hypothetical protein
MEFVCFLFLNQTNQYSYIKRKNVKCKKANVRPRATHKGNSFPDKQAREEMCLRGL